MLETFTPAVCGSRKRQIVAQSLFAAAAVATAAALGLVLGLAGALLGAERAVLAAAALALLAAAREAGLLRVPLPQARRQVPERWRFELPLPVWATGYGAGLGAGVFTFQPVSTFWVACAGALALASPLTGALCLSLYGAGRAFMVVWPRRRADDPTAAVERIVGKRGALVRANVLALLACGLLLAAAPAAGGATRIARDAYDPTFDARVLAYGTQRGEVVVRPPGEPNIVFPDASHPSIDGRYLAYRDSQGIRVVRWRNGTEVRRISTSGATLPALDWPRIAFVRKGDRKNRIVVRDLRTNRSDVEASAGGSVDLGRPSLHRGRLAWRTASRSLTRIFVKRLSTGSRRTVAYSKIALLGNPSVRGRRIAWTEARFGVSRLKLAWGSGSGRTVETVRSRTRSYWTTAIGRGRIYSTRWTFGSGAADLYKTSF
ncbi:MAG TPA: hypothetical protein VFN93_01085 [Gaiellaceae bacterium]|nr:hypothetical protein [Gaiellaceae bacterium]